MKKKIITLIISLCVVGGAIALAVAQPKKSPAQPVVTPAQTSSSTSKKELVQKTFTLAQVSQHATSADCWTAINGGVYNLSDWIAKHPGGESAILSICGKDGSDAFNNQHGGQGKPERLLATYLIGPLK